MKTVIRIVRLLIPRYIRYLYYALPTYYYDLKRYYAYGTNNSHIDSELKLEAQIVKQYHVIEKGLTMPESRLGFGHALIIKLIDNCLMYHNKYGKNSEQLEQAVRVVFEYEIFHLGNNYQISQDLKNTLKRLRDLYDELSPSVQISIDKNEYFAHSDKPFDLFSHSRYSLRNYTEENLDVEALLNSLELAKKCPSACNRQPSRVYIFTDKEKIYSILKTQGGSRGFSHLVDKLIIITAELGVYELLAERNQAYIDGGIFTMNLLYALHFNKIATCVLNCSNSVEKDIKLREISGINNSEVFISMISCGIAPEIFKLPLSKRNPINAFVRIID